MDIVIFWEIVQQNADHIKTLNHEMGAVQAELTAISHIIKWMLGCMSATFIVVLGAFLASLRNIYWTKKNGNGK